MIKVIKECSEILDFAWELCQDNTKVSYPIADSKEQIRNRIEKYIKSDDRRVIGYYENDKLIGVCMYDWIDEDKYAQTGMLLIKENYNIVADKMMDYIREHLRGYRIYVGISADNKEAIEFLKERKISCTDASFNTKLLRKDFKFQDIKNEIRKLELKDFDEYAKFHAKYSEEMFWNGSHLREAFDRFVIFVYRDASGIRGSIFTKIISSREAEVFGLFIDDVERGKGIEEDLIGAMLKYFYEQYKEMDEILYFIQEDSKEELSYAIKYGFQIVDRYRCYEGNF